MSLSRDARKSLTSSAVTFGIATAGEPAVAGDGSARVRGGKRASTWGKVAAVICTTGAALNACDARCTLPSLARQRRARLMFWGPRSRVVSGVGGVCVGSSENRASFLPVVVVVASAGPCCSMLMITSDAACLLSTATCSTNALILAWSRSRGVSPLVSFDSCGSRVLAAWHRAFEAVQMIRSPAWRGQSWCLRPNPP